DPEMLGHIFENLLEENRTKGTYYTPKEIVHYMCRESLTEYLYTGLGEKVPLEGVKRFIYEGEGATIAPHSEEVLSLLRQVKVCDPAIGSGAFPMGVLLEIFYAVEVLWG